MSTSTPTLRRARHLGVCVALLALVACGQTQPSHSGGGSSATTATTATDPTDQGAPGPDTVRTDGWRAEHFRYTNAPGVNGTPNTTILVDVTNEQSTTRTGKFVITLTRYASGGQVTGTEAVATNVAPGKTVTVSGPAAIPLSSTLDMSGFYWSLQTTQ